MGNFFNSLEEATRYAEENFKKSYFCCSCALGQQVSYFVDKFISPLQLGVSIEPVFHEAQNNFGTDWKIAYFEIMIHNGIYKKSIAVSVPLDRSIYDKMREIMNGYTIFEHIGDAMKSELFIYMVNHLGEQ